MRLAKKANDVIDTDGFNHL